jgi:hypothetical protein
VPPPYQLIPKELQITLLMRSTLLEWASYSLLDRQNIIEQRWGVKVSRFILSSFYRNHNVGLKTASYAFHRNNRSPFELEGKKKEFMQKVLGHMYHGRMLIFMDETSTHR